MSRRPGGLMTTGSSTSGTRLARCSTCSMPTRSTWPRRSMAKPVGGASMRCRWAGCPITSMSGTACWSGRVHPRRHADRVDHLLVLLVRPGPAGGAQGSGPRATSGPLACRCRSPRPLDTQVELTQFQLAHQALLDEPGPAGPGRRTQGPRGHDRRRSATIPRSGARAAHRPTSVSWTNSDNNKAFLAQTVVLTANGSLSIPAALRTERPDDYRRNAVTIDWPRAANGEPLVLDGYLARAVVFKEGGHAASRGGVRPFPRRGGLARPLADVRGRPIHAADAQASRPPFWLDPTTRTACARRSRA